MTRPTSEQIKALRKGDVVTVRAVVTTPQDSDGDIRFRTSDRYESFCLPSEIMTIEQRQIAAGDRIMHGSWPGVVRFIDDGEIVVRFDNGILGVRNATDLTVIP